MLGFYSALLRRDRALRADRAEEHAVAGAGDKGAAKRLAGFIKALRKR